MTVTMKFEPEDVGFHSNQPPQHSWSFHQLSPGFEGQTNDPLWTVTRPLIRDFETNRYLDRDRYRKSFGKSFFKSKGWKTQKNFQNFFPVKWETISKDFKMTNVPPVFLLSVWLIIGGQLGARANSFNSGYYSPFPPSGSDQVFYDFSPLSKDTSYHPVGFQQDNKRPRQQQQQQQQLHGHRATRDLAWKEFDAFLSGDVSCYSCSGTTRQNYKL